MDKCYICDIEVNDYNSVIFPERDLNSKLVFYTVLIAVIVLLTFFVGEI